MCESKSVIFLYIRVAVFKNIGDSPASKSVTVGVACVRHRVISLFVFKKLLEAVVNRFFVGTDQSQRSG